MKIILAASEAVPFAKTGGLADVTGSLAVELGRMGQEVAVFLPLYRTVRERFGIEAMGIEILVPLGDRTETGWLWRSASWKGGATAYFIEHDGFFDRDFLYGDAAGDYPDNAPRFIFFARCVLEAAKKLGFDPDIIHTSDWQTGLIPLYLKTIYKENFPRAASVHTIHNLGYQGIFWHWDMPLIGVGWEHFRMEGIEFHGRINLMKAGIVYSDRITTVSPTYAREILTEEHGFGLHGALAARRADIVGILNGIDTDIWNPATDAHIAEPFSAEDTSGKAACKEDLQRRCGFRTDKETPLLGVVARLSTQKGIDLIAESAEDFLVGRGTQMVILGTGDTAIEDRMKRLRDRHRGKIFVRTGFDEDLAHRIYAGSDLFLMPSRYEPCGLGQMIAMRYGAVPVVRKTGGLADTVRERGAGRNGFLFSGSGRKPFVSAIDRALAAYHEPDVWREIVRGAMTYDSSWPERAGRYVALYEGLLGGRKKTRTVVENSHGG